MLQKDHSRTQIYQVTTTNPPLWPKSFNMRFTFVKNKLGHRRHLSVLHEVRVWCSQSLQPMVRGKTKTRSQRKRWDDRPHHSTEVSKSEPFRVSTADTWLSSDDFLMTLWLQASADISTGWPFTASRTSVGARSTGLITNSFYCPLFYLKNPPPLWM